MNEIGILSGRIVPENYEQYQVFPKHWKLDMSRASDIGFDFVELVYDADGEVMELLNHHGEFRNGELNPNVKSLCIAALTGISIVDTAQRAVTLKASFRLANAISIDMVVVPLLEDHAPSSIAEMKSVIIDLVSSAESASYHGRLALESDFDSLALRDLINELNIEQRMGLCLDTGNICFLGKDPVEEILAAEEALFHIHLKDRTHGGGNCKPGHGQVDFGRVFKALEAVNYEGLCALETPYGSDAYESASDNLSYFRRKWN